MVSITLLRGFNKPKAVRAKQHSFKARRANSDKAGRTDRFTSVWDLDTRPPASDETQATLSNNHRMQVFSLNSHVTLNKIDYIVGHKTHLNKLE